MKPGQYAVVRDLPAAWEGSGESEADRTTLIGHVCLILEHDEKLNVCLVKFPDPSSDGDTSCGQRNIECRSLSVVSVPVKPIFNNLFE